MTLLRKALSLAVLLALVLSVQVPSARAANSDTILVSRASGAAGAKGNGHSIWSWLRTPSISADGRFVAFDSQASNLHPDDGDSAPDVFVRDLQTNETLLVSRASGVAGAKGIGEQPSISGDGRFVAFQGSVAPHSGAAFVRDLQTSETILVSRGTGAAGTPGTGGGPWISADGRFVAFTGSIGPDGGIFVRDLLTQTTTLVVGSAAGGGRPSISTDGRFVAFHSNATNVTPDDADSFTDIFLHDLQTRTTTLVSRASGAGAKGNSYSFSPVISANGRFVVFGSNANNLSPYDTDTLEDYYVRDLQTNSTILASRATTAAAKDRATDGFELQPSISADGRFVAFPTRASNLTPDDPDALIDVFVRDLQTNTTMLASRASGAGAKGNAGSLAPAISADGNFVAFSSFASNFSPDDATDQLRDVYVRGLGPLPPTAGSPTGPVGALGKKAPKLTLTGKRRQSIRRRAISFTAKCDVSCTLEASASISVPKASKVFRLRKVRRSLPAGKRVTLKLRLSKKALRAAKRALRKRKRVGATVSAKATDAAGNATTETRKVRLVR